MLNGIGIPEKFKAAKGRGGPRPGDVPDRRQHARSLLAAIGQIERIDDASATYLEFIGRPGENLKNDSLNASGLTLLRVTDGDKDAGIPPRATVMALHNAKGISNLEGKIADFESKDGNPNKHGVTRPTNADFVQSIGEITSAGLRELWRHPGKSFPETLDECDWEIWLDPNDSDSFIERASDYGLVIHEDRLTFPDDIVILATSTSQQLSEAINHIGVVRAIAQPGVPMDFVDTMEPEEQADWVNELADRSQYLPPNNGKQSYITLMDTGISRANPLIQPALARGDRHTAIVGWDLSDTHGHGTAMAGLSLYGDLQPVLSSAGPVEIKHRLESAKVIPDAGRNPHHLLGAITEMAINAVEHDPERMRTFALANTTDEDSHSQWCSNFMVHRD